jgi:hypothetical protein
MDFSLLIMVVCFTIFPSFKMLQHPASRQQWDQSTHHILYSCYCLGQTPSFKTICGKPFLFTCLFIHLQLTSVVFARDNTCNFRKSAQAITNPPTKAESTRLYVGHSFCSLTHISLIYFMTVRGQRLWGRPWLPRLCLVLSSWTRSNRWYAPNPRGIFTSWPS